jgi:hypothetical protein
VLATGSLVSWLLDAQIWTACAGVALLYYPVAHVCVERAPRPRLLLRPVGLIRWLHAPSRAIHHLGLQWSKQVSVNEPEEHPSTQETNEAAPAPEWRIAPN